MKFCDYGCGQESKFQFANGKWCCSKSRNQCVKEREKNSKSCKGKNKGQLPWNKGKKIGPRSLEDRKKISDNHANVFGSKNPMFGKKVSNEIKRKISESLIGEKNHFYGKHHSEETKKKMKKLRAKQDCSHYKYTVKQIDLTTGNEIKVWPSASEASMVLCGKKISAIPQVCRGKPDKRGYITTSALGFGWEYIK